MTLTIVETRAVTGGVDTHADTHVAAALDSIGGMLGVREFPATPVGYAGLLGWLGGWIVVTAKTAAGRASPTRWTRSAPPAPRCPGERSVCRKAAMVRSRRSGH